MMVVFYGCPAFVCQVLGKRRAKVWLDWPDKLPIPYDPQNTIELDLDKSPSIGKGGVIEVDDTIAAPPGGKPGLTTLGPQWPLSFRDGVGHACEAGVWLAEHVWRDAVQKGRMRYPPCEHKGRVIGPEVYRWQSVLLPDASLPLSGRRYHGFHARVLSTTGTKSSFRVWPATASLASTDDSVVLTDVELQNPNHVVQESVQEWERPAAPGTEGPLFLSWALADQLISPKLPLGESGGIRFPKRAPSPTKHALTSRALDANQLVAPPKPICGGYPFGNPVNVSHDSPDDILKVLQDQLQPHLVVRNGREGLLDALREIEACESLVSPIRVDLISHASSDRQVLVFDGWELAAGDDLRDFCDQLGRLRRISQLRLLGCGTGNHAAACEAMNMLRERLGVEVLGTTTLLSSESFSARKYTGGYMTDQRACAEPEPYRWDRYRARSASRLFDALHMLPLGSSADKARSRLLRSLEQVLDLSERYVVPGLLLEPLETYRVPLGGGGETVLCDVLLDNELLRVRAPGDDVGEIFRMRSQTSLAKVLSLAPTLPFRAQ